MAMGFQLPSMQNAFWNTTRVKDDNQNTRSQLADKEGRTWCLWSIYFPKEMLLNQTSHQTVLRAFGKPDLAS